MNDENKISLIRPDVVIRTDENPKTPIEGVVQLLEHLLEEARRGDITQLACSYVDADGGAASAHTLHISMGLITGLDLLHTRLKLEWISATEEEFLD